MTPDEVVALARRHARDHGYQEARYETRFTVTGDEWRVEFSPGASTDKPAPGD